MTKVELVNKIYTKTESYTKAEVEDLLNTMITVLGEELLSNSEVSLAGFGTFKVVKRAQRKGRNPRSGKEMVIPACNSVKFTLSKRLKEALQK